jgi:hypothetical protein
MSDMKMSLIAAMAGIAACSTLLAGDAPTTRPFQVGRLEAKPICESSGIVESRKHPGVYWTHNDSGNPPVLYAVRRDGSLVNEFPVRCVAIDWEDIAIDDEGHLYLGDIGNNGNLRPAIGVMMLDEPDPVVAPDPKKPLQPVKQWPLSFADGKRMDSESLFVWKESGYVIKKAIDGSPTTLWKFSLVKDGPQTLELVATLPLRTAVCGADLSRDGTRLVLIAGEGPYLLGGFDGDLSRAGEGKVDSIRIKPGQNEAICFTEGGVLSTSEQRDVFFFPMQSFGAPDTQPAK